MRNDGNNLSLLQKLIAWFAQGASSMCSDHASRDPSSLPRRPTPGYCSPELPLPAVFPQGPLTVFYGTASYRKKQ